MYLYTGILRNPSLLCICQETTFCAITPLFCFALPSPLSLSLSLPIYLPQPQPPHILYTGRKLLGLSTYPSEFVLSSLLGRLHFKGSYFLLPHIFNLYVPWYSLLDLLSFHSRPVFLNLECS